MGALAHTLMYGKLPHPQHLCCENFWHPHARDPVPSLPYLLDITLLYMLTLNT